MPPPAIEDVSEADRAAEREPGVDLGHPCIRIAGIGENEEIEVRELAGPGDRIVRCLQPGKNPSHVLIADRHDDRGADIGVQRCIGCGRARNRELVPTQQLEDEARDRVGSADEIDQVPHDLLGEPAGVADDLPLLRRHRRDRRQLIAEHSQLFDDHLRLEHVLRHIDVLLLQSILVLRQSIRTLLESIRLRFKSTVPRLESIVSR